MIILGFAVRILKDLTIERGRMRKGAKEMLVVKNSQRLIMADTDFWW